MITIEENVKMLASLKEIYNLKCDHCGSGIFDSGATVAQIHSFLFNIKSNPCVVVSHPEIFVFCNELHRQIWGERGNCPHDRTVSEDVDDHHITCLDCGALVKA